MSLDAAFLTFQRQPVGRTDAVHWTIDTLAQRVTWHSGLRARRLLQCQYVLLNMHTVTPMT